MIFRGGEFSTGEMGNFHPALTKATQLLFTAGADSNQSKPLEQLTERELTETATLSCVSLHPKITLAIKHYHFF